MKQHFSLRISIFLILDFQYMKVFVSLQWETGKGNQNHHEQTTRIIFEGNLYLRKLGQKIIVLDQKSLQIY